MVDRIAREWASAGTAGAIAEGLFNPTAVLQVRGQLQPAASTYTLVRDAVMRDGILRGMWLPGLVANCTRAFSYTGFRVGLYPTARDALPGDGFATRMLAGALTGGVGATLFAPVELVRVRLAGATVCTGTLSTCVALARENSVGGLWRGAGPFALRCSCYSGAQCSIYDASKRWLLASRVAGPVENARLHLAASCIAGVGATIACHPLDTVKTLVMHQASTMAGGSPIRTLMHELKAKGSVGAIRALYGGLLPALLSRGPMVMVFFPLVEQLRTRVFGLEYI